MINYTQNEKYKEIVDINKYLKIQNTDKCGGIKTYSLGSVDDCLKPIFVEKDENKRNLSLFSNGTIFAKQNDENGWS